MAKRRRRGPVKVFLSYSSEDYDLVCLIKDAFDRLKDLSDGNIYCIVDKVTFEIGAKAALIEEISEKLFERSLAEKMA